MEGVVRIGGTWVRAHHVNEGGSAAGNARGDTAGVLWAISRAKAAVPAGALTLAVGCAFPVGLLGAFPAEEIDVSEMSPCDLLTDEQLSRHGFGEPQSTTSRPEANCAWLRPGPDGAALASLRLEIITFSDAGHYASKDDARETDIDGYPTVAYGGDDSYVFVQTSGDTGVDMSMTDPRNYNDPQPSAMPIAKDLVANLTRENS